MVQCNQLSSAIEAFFCLNNLLLHANNYLSPAHLLLLEVWVHFMFVFIMCTDIKFELCNIRVVNFLINHYFSYLIFCIFLQMFVFPTR